MKIQRNCDWSQRRCQQSQRVACLLLAFVNFLELLEWTSTSAVTAWIPSSSLVRPRQLINRSCVAWQRLASSATSCDDEPQQQPLPTSRPTHHVTIEYCTGCRWMMRSAWMAQELLTTFQEELHGVTLIPSRPPNPGGVFAIHVVETPSSGATSLLLWDRKERGGFPELKQLKQLIRDVVSPEQFLGHSDTVDRTQSAVATTATVAPPDDCVDCQTPTTTNLPTSTAATVTTNASATPTSLLDSTLNSAHLPNVAITYCTGCRWLLRAAWLGQEILTTFYSQINSLTLVPSRPPQKGGTFTVTLNDELVWDRSEQGRFPDVKELKQLIRDRVAPEKDLGHSDSKNEDEDNDDDDSQEELTMNEEEAAKLRNFFGVP